ncbi:MAG: 6-phosphogluconolactonase [Puniceicoccaceae bacterium]
MEERKTIYGNVRIGNLEEIFSRTVEVMEINAATCGDPFTIGLTGGSTPKAFYTWAVENEAISKAVLEQAMWSVSDERVVPLDHPESNFGNANRLLLTPLGVAEGRKLNWPMMLDPHSLAAMVERRWQDRFGYGHTFDLCFLGMGDDGHTASIFPESPMMGAIAAGTLFAPVEVPEKGWRISITPDGLAACSKIVITVTGAAKAERLKAVLDGEPDQYPVQLVSRFPEKVEWLVDTEAAKGLQASRL